MVCFFDTASIRSDQAVFPVVARGERVDNLRVVSGIIYVLKRGLQWKDAPKEYGPYKTL